MALAGVLVDVIPRLISLSFQGVTTIILGQLWECPSIGSLYKQQELESETAPTAAAR